MMTNKINTRQAQIRKIKKNLEELGEIMPGSLSKQYNVCGNPNCRCKDSVNPRKHGPYYNLSYTWNSKAKQYSYAKSSWPKSGSKSRITEFSRS